MLNSASLDRKHVKSHLNLQNSDELEGFQSHVSCDQAAGPVGNWIKIKVDGGI